MRKCHYTYDKEVGKVLIPGCWSVAIYNDMDLCDCRPETFVQFEKEKYNQILKKKNQEIKELEKEVFRLERIVRKLYKI